MRRHCLCASGRMLASRYGDIYTLWLGHTPIVVLNNFEAVKEALITHSEDFAERPRNPCFENLVGSACGIIFSNGHAWKQQRRFSLMTLRNLGLGKRSLEGCVQHQATCLVQALAQEKGRPMDPYSSILSSVGNLIGNVLFGHWFSTADDRFHCLVKGSKAMEEFSSTLCSQLYNAFPSVMKHLQPIIVSTMSALRHWKKLELIIREEIQSHQRSWVPEEPRDFIDLYLAQLEKNKDDPNSPFTELNMVQVIMDLFIAGLDTSTIALSWALLYMMTYPEIQEQVQEELNTVLGPSHVISYEDRKILPFTNAVIHETQRVSSMTATGVFHKCTKDTKLQGLPISKGTIILPNLYSIHYDPDHWETPHKFNPSHFLDKDGNFTNNEAFLPFSAGVRVCLGEKFARTTLFIFFTNLLRAFRFQMPEGVKEINTEPILGSALQPHPFKACAIARKTVLNPAA
ncbi:cytochrome P450 2J4-like isoform X2 [Hemicordylus capensis]|uniref:cytochrome P450 2J4-like isoform X2 n=1 Tax=Hemicordylus capensis TaxID=884348 RepID=UPI00230346D1|nr:cytochrome P450 2J4-like isoform X2 [Hemicordylus capensis]